MKSRQGSTTDSTLHKEHISTDLTKLQTTGFVGRETHKGFPGSQSRARIEANSTSTQIRWCQFRGNIRRLHRRVRSSTVSMKPHKESIWEVDRTPTPNCIRFEADILDRAELQTLLA